MMLAVRRKRDLGWSELYCDHQLPEPTSPVAEIPSPPPRKRSRCFIYGSNTQPERNSTGPPAQENPFDRMPDEILKHIFSNLSKRDLLSCMSLCRRFYRVGSDRDLWHSADYFGLKFIDNSLIYAVLRGAKMLRAANASSRTPLLDPIALEPSRLQYVDLTNAAISKPLLISLLNASQDLRKLSLESLTFCDDDICSSIARNHQLNTLNLCMVTGLTTRGITQIMKNCEKIVSLNVAWTPMDTECLMSLVSLLPQGLRELNIAGCADRFTDQHLRVLCQRCPKLEKLCVADNSHLSPTGLFESLSELTELRHLDLSRCHRLQPEDMWALESLPKLQFLSCHSFPDWGDYEREIRKGLYRVLVNAVPDLSSIARPQPNQHKQDRVLWGHPMR